MSWSSTDHGSPRNHFALRRGGSLRDYPWLAPVVLALLLAACVSRTTQTYRSQYQYIEAGEAEQTSWNNVAEIGVQNHLGEGVEYRFDERFVYTESEVDVPGSGDFDQTNVINQPSLDLRTTVGTVTWEQGYEFRDARTRSDTFPDNDQQRVDVLQRLDWEPTPDLPQVTTWFNYRTTEDDRSVDEERTEAVFEISQTAGAFDYVYTFENEVITQNTVDTERDRLEHILSVTHADEYLDGELSSSVNLFVDERDTDITSSTGAGVIQIFPITGLSVIDTTPQISILSNTPTLIDGDTLTPTGINIGGGLSGGQLNWNIGGEVLAGGPIDEIRLFTETPIDPIFQNQFTFSVWTSNDNNFWTLVTSSAQVIYEEALRRFRIRIPEVDARYVKAVNTSSPAAAPAVNVTEIEFFVGSLGAGGSTDREIDDSKRSLTGNLTWRPTSELVLSYDIFAQTFETEDSGVKTRDSVRIDNGLTAFWSPSSLVDFTARAENRTEDDDITRDEDFTVLNGIVGTHPLDTLDVTLNLTYTDRQINDQDDVKTEAAQLTSSAQLLETLQFDVGFEVNTQTDSTNQREIDRTILSASLFAQLTPTLDLTLGLKNDNADITGPGAGGVPDPSEDRYEVLFLYRPSERVTAEVRLEYIDIFAGSGLDQRYRLDWVPFRDGSLDIQFNYDRTDTASVFDEQIDRYAVLTRWTLNPSAFLEVNLAREEIDGADNTTVATATLNVTP